MNTRDTRQGRVISLASAREEVTDTPLGWSLTGTLMAMYEWAAEHLPEVHGARLFHEGERPQPRALAAA
jgi:DNA-binding HxlR family transcriptional regulator